MAKISGTTTSVVSPGVGLQSILPAKREKAHLPAADEFVPGNVEAGGLESLFARDGQGQALRQALTPLLDHPDQMEPARLQRSLESAADKLSQIKNDVNCRVMVRDVLSEMMNNTELLRAYTDMMIGG